MMIFSGCPSALAFTIAVLKCVVTMSMLWTLVRVSPPMEIKVSPTRRPRRSAWLPSLTELSPVLKINMKRNIQ